MLQIELRFNCQRDDGDARILYGANDTYSPLVIGRVMMGIINVSA